MHEIESFIPEIPEGEGKIENGYMSIHFGNGLNIDSVVVDKVVAETLTQDPVSQREKPILVRQHHALTHGPDVVQIHFTPTIASGETINRPEMVLEDQKDQVAYDCILGLLSLAFALQEKSIPIVDHDPDEELYLLAQTNQRFAAFLRFRCGFRGAAGGNEAWITGKTFLSKQNISYLFSQLNQFKENILKSGKSIQRWRSTDYRVPLKGIN